MDAAAYCAVRPGWRDGDLRLRQQTEWRHSGRADDGFADCKRHKFRQQRGSERDRPDRIDGAAMTTKRIAHNLRTNKKAEQPHTACEPEKEQQQIQGRPVPTMMRFSMRSLILTGLIVLLGAAICLQPAAGQTVNASLGGIVSDATGARVAGAAVTLLNEASKDTRKSKSNAEGVYQFSAIPTGTYTVTIEHTGFEAYVESGIELHPNDARTLPVISLQVGSVTASVTVTAQNEVIDSSERSSLITASDIKKLSTVGRDASELLKTQPGFAIRQGTLDNGLGSDPAVVGSGGSGLANYVGNGAPGNGASVISDGANVTDPGNGSGQTQTVNMDMVSEVKIETSNFGADTAKGPTVITVVGKSGTSDFHGSVYGFARTSQLNAEDWFMKYQGLPQIPDRYIYPGFSVQGPLIIPGTSFNSHKKVVFSAGAEDYVQRNVYSYGSALTSFINALVPTDQSTNAGGEPGMRQGNFSQAELASYLGTSAANIEAQCTPTGTLTTYYHVCAEPFTTDGVIGTSGTLGGQFTNGAASFDPGAAALLKADFPLPTGPTVNGYNWRVLNLGNPDIFQIRGRVDVAVNDNNKVYGVYNTELGRTTGIPEQIYYSPSSGGSVMGGLDTPGKIISTSTSNTASINYARIFSARSTNEAFAAVSYVADYYTSGDPKDLLKTSWNYPYNGIYTRNSCAGCGSDDIPQLGTYGSTSGDGLPLAITPDFSNGRYISRKFLPSGGDNFSFLLKSHTLKAGVYLERDTANQTDLSPLTNGQIQSYYIPSGSITDLAGTHNTAQCHFNDCGGNYLADFMLGDIDSFQQQNYNPNTSIFYWTIAGFAQDSWKATKRLTVDLGLRVDHLSAWTDSHGLGLAAFSPKWYAEDIPTGSTPSALCLPGVRWHGNGKAGACPTNANLLSSLPLSGDKSRVAFVSPRFGLAYDLFGTGKTVLRGGWGMYRSHDSWNDFSPAAGTAQGLVVSTAGGAGISLAGVDKTEGTQTLICNAGGTTGCPTIAAVDPTDDQQPLTMTYSFTVSQRAPFSSAFEIAYVGNQSQNLLTDSIQTSVPGVPYDMRNINAIPLGAMFLPDPNPNGSNYGQILNPSSTNVAQQNDYRPFPFYTDIMVPRHIVWANYNALQTSWNRQKGRLNYGVNYTWSKALGVRGGYNNGWTSDPTNMRADYGPLAFDRTNVFNASYSYDEGNLFHLSRVLNGLANGWFISGITNVQSGPNLQAIYSPDLALTGIVGTPQSGSLNINSLTLLGTPDVTLMPKLTCNPTAHLRKNQFVNGDCFAIAPFGENGPANLGYLRGPRFLNSDLTVQKKILLSEKKNLELRLSGFNFLNHPITTFSTRYTNEASLQMHGNDFASATLQNGTNPSGASCSVVGSPCFGYAGYKTGRRVVEVSARFNF
jgi:hypothetical protein